MGNKVVIKSNLSERFRINKVIGRERGIKLIEGEEVEINEKEYEILKDRVKVIKKVGDK